MSDLARAVKAQRKDYVEGKKYPGQVTNFMGGTSFQLSALESLKLVSASSIFGEPSYYRDGSFGTRKVLDGVFDVDAAMQDYAITFGEDLFGRSTSELFCELTDRALSEDFAGTLGWAQELRSTYLLRLNPQVIMVRAAMHPGRQAYTETHPGVFQQINSRVMFRGDDVISQFMYFLYWQGSAKKVPGILKRSWAKRIEQMTRYELCKYGHSGVGLIDVIRICHAHNSDIDELMRTGKVQVSEESIKWDSLRMQGLSWEQILKQIRMPHMALLRNLRGIFFEVSDRELCVRMLEQLKRGVPGGRQFPFRYLSSWKAVGENGVNFSMMLRDGLEECMDIACENLPKLSGRAAFLTDNSGSAWGDCTSSYGTMRIAEIGNLSSVIGAVNSEEGYVYPFGDKLLRYEVSKRQGVLNQASKISGEARQKAGGATETGIWTFLSRAIQKQEHWDHIFIYSDCQAGHGGLYGTTESCSAYAKAGFSYHHRYIHVAKLLDVYRQKVNPKVNVYCIQTAGYDNVLVPENSYRTAVLYGWTGAELVYADMMSSFWDAVDAKHGN